MHVHSHGGNHSDQCECSPNYLKGLCLSKSTTESEREAVAVCYLCGCIVAHCGGVILQVAGRLTPLHRKTVKSKMERWKAFSHFILTNPHTRNKDQTELWNSWSPKTQEHTHSLISPTKCHRYLLHSSCVHGYVVKQLHGSTRGFSWGQIENNPN